MKRRPRVLLTNDDGYRAEGINTLFKHLARRYEVFMVAPDREQSASSHSLTLNRPLRMHKLDKNHYITDGTPTDCVMLAMHTVFKGTHPDLIISGINHGGNMGDDVTYSGTIAAAIEGAILRIRSLAVSMANWEPGDSMEQAAKFTLKLIPLFDRLDLDSATFLNVNFPRDEGTNYDQYEFTSQGMRHYKDIVVRKRDPRGHNYYWIGGRPKWRKLKGTDFAAVSQGRVSITPMKLEFTDESVLERVKEAGLRL